jgi:vacuolar-type H+-ATPase subunit C/Vma6
VASALSRYAYVQARIRARVARLLSRRQLEMLSEAADEPALERELVALGHPERISTLLATFDDVLDLLGGAPHDLVDRYRGRYECENLKLLLRAVERRIPFDEVWTLLHPVGALGQEPVARAVLEADSLPEAVERLPARPFGELLRRRLRAGGSRSVERFWLETLAEREAYEAVWRTVDSLDVSDRVAASRLLGTKLDCVNLVRFLRLVGHHRLAPEELLALAIRGGRHLGASERAVLAHQPPREWSAHLAHTPYASALAHFDSPAALEAELARVLARRAERGLAGPPFQIGLVLAYLLWLEIQCADLQRVLQGKRLHRRRDWIVSGLASERSA